MHNNTKPKLRIIKHKYQKEYDVAHKLIYYYTNKIQGKNNTESGLSWQYGSLTLDEALYIAQYALTRGLNPFVDLHLWYDPSQEQLIIHEHYKILVAWARLQSPFIHKFFDPTSQQRQQHNSRPEDLMQICYILKDCNQTTWQRVYAINVQTLHTTAQPDFQLATRATYEGLCPSGIGIVNHEEITTDTGQLVPITIKNWTWTQTAQIRALRNAIAQSHGSPTIAETHAYAQQLNPGLTLDALAHPEYNPTLPPTAQVEFFKMHQSYQQRQAKWNKMTPQQQKAAFKQNVTLLRGNEKEQEGID